MVAACRPRLDALTTGLEAIQRDIGVGDEVGEDAERVGTTANAGGDRIGQPAIAIQELGPRLGADHPLKLTDQQREGVRAGDTANQVVSVVDGGDPVAHRVVHRVLQGLRPRLDRDHLSTQQPHPGDVEGLPLGVDLAHVDGAVEPEQSGGGGSRDPVLTGAGLRNHPRLTHPAGQQCLAEHIVDLVRACVVQILSLQHDDRRLSSSGLAAACSLNRFASVIGLGRPV